MRLKELVHVLKEVLPGLNPSYEKITINGTNYTRIRQLLSLKHSLLLLNEHHIFTDILVEISELPIYGVGDDWINLNNLESTIFTDNISRLRNSITDILDVLDPQVKEEEPTSIYIKLPKINDLEDMARSISVFHKIFSQTILADEIGGKITVKSVDNGSFWIEISVQSQAAVGLIGALTTGAVLIYKEREAIKLKNEQRRTKKLNNDRLQYLQEAEKTLLDEYVEFTATNIKNEFYKEEDPTRIKLLKESMNWLADELNKGAEVRPALDAPKEVEESFPDIRKFLAMFPKIKEITNGNNDKENESA